MKLILQRFYNGDDCTLGILYDAQWSKICLTLEEPWKGNRRGVSCIPVGKYKLVPHEGAKFQDVWRFESVEGRDAVLIHSGNTVDNIEGCIVVGHYFDRLKGKRAVMNSVGALKSLKSFIGRGGDGKLKEFELEIKDL